MTKRFPIMFHLLALAVAVAALSGCGIRRKKYETPIATDSKQPDKTLFDKAVNDIEKSRYEVARLTLQTLINTYPDSEYLAKAKLAIADAWYRQGGTSALAQAEAEYKDFITFFPTMPEASEAQLKVAMIHYNQMEKADRDHTHARRAEDEFKQLLIQFPDSPFKEEAKQRLREVQEVIAEHEFRVARQYYLKGNPRASISRLKELTQSYPNYSGADQALWMLGGAYEMGGKDFRLQSAAAYSRIVSDYPISELLDSAKQKLTAWKMPIPEAKPEAYARMKYDLEHRETPGMWDRATGILRKRPDVGLASKAGEPVLLPGARPVEEQPVTAGDTSGVGSVSAIRLESVPASSEAAGATGTAVGATGTAAGATGTAAGATGTAAGAAGSTSSSAPAPNPATPAAPASKSEAPAAPAGTDPGAVDPKLPNRAQDEVKSPKKKGVLGRIFRRKK